MTYADGFNVRSAANVSLTSVGDALDGLLVAYQLADSTGAVTNSTTSYADITSMTKSVAVAAGEIVKVEFYGLVDADTANDTVMINLLRDATQLVETGWTAKANAQDSQMKIDYIDAPAAGTYTYKAQFKNSTGSRAVHVYYRHFRITVHQNA